MQLYIIPKQKFKSIYQVMVGIQLFIVAAMYAMYRYGIFFTWGPTYTELLRWIILLAFVGASIFVMRVHKAQLENIRQLADFDEQLQAYEQYYRRRHLWALLQTVMCCILLFATGRFTYFYWAIITTVSGLILLPNIALFKRELQNDAIVLN